jgi:hypothetical protein
MRQVVLDLDDPSDVERVWEELEKRHELRAIAPEFRVGVERAFRRAVKAGRIHESEGEAIRRELDEAHPAIVLAAHWKKLISDRPALGAFDPQPSPGDMAGPNTWLRQDSARLTAVVIEMRRFEKDERRVAAAALDHARRLGIDENAAVRSVALGLVQARQHEGGTSNAR